jgi:CheY-like chemotaxis protein
VEITVRDQGIGIPPAHLARIFDPYFTTKEKGSGLGLATSYSIIGNHGGIINVASELGKGSVFTIYLPASRQRPEPLPDKKDRGSEKRGRVLVMDDEEVVRKVAGELIAALGHRVELVRHGEEAIAAYEKARDSGVPFDAVILDLTIRGGMGGMETLQKLKERDPGVKAIVSSGYSDDSILAEYTKQGFAGVLSKPYSLDGLRTTLNEVIKRS